MEINKYIKGKIIYFAFTFLLIVIVGITSSYAFSSNVDYKKYTNYLETTFVEKKVSPISRESVITIKNIGDERREFSLYAKALDKENAIEANKIYYSINSGYDSLLSNSTNNIIYKGYLEADEEIDLNVNLWLDIKKLDNNDEGKNIAIDFDVQ